MKSILDTFRVGEDLPIESKPVSDTLDKVQQQVESYYYDIRQKVRPSVHPSVRDLGLV